jgi:hypothetical protein
MEDRVRREGRVLAAPMARQQHKKLAAVATGLAEATRPSLRDGLTAYTALSPETGLDCPRRLRTMFASMASASGGQDHTALPYALMILVSHHHRVHRIPASRIVTIAIRPSASRRDID